MPEIIQNSALLTPYNTDATPRFKRDLGSKSKRNVLVCRGHGDLYKGVIDGDYRTITTIWRTALTPFKNITDSQVVESGGVYWIQDKKIPFGRYRGNPLKRLGKDEELKKTRGVDAPDKKKPASVGERSWLLKMIR